MRVKTGIIRRRRHKKVLKAAKGFRGASGTVFKQAKQATVRAAAYSTRDRKVLKRDMRKLWIIRINAASRANGLSYSKFMHGLKVAGVDMNRKMLAELAVSDKEGFATLAELAKSKLA